MSEKENKMSAADGASSGPVAKDGVLILPDPEGSKYIEYNLFFLLLTTSE